MAEFYIKASEAARRIGVSLVTAKRMINDSRLIGEKIGLPMVFKIRQVNECFSCT